jgi:hypothetical protein
MEAFMRGKLINGFARGNLRSRLAPVNRKLQMQFDSNFQLARDDLRSPVSAFSAARVISDA